MDIKTEIIVLGDDVSIHVEVAGEGEPIVLLPGLGCSSQCFHPLMQELGQRGFHTVAVNPRGILNSHGPLADLTAHDFAADIGAVVDWTGAAPLHVVGWAFGAGFARCLAADSPEKVRSVILLGAAGSATPAPKAFAALSRLATNDYVSPADREHDLSLAFLAPTSDDSLARSLDFGLWPEATTAQRSAGAITPREDWWSAGGKPMLVIQGREDQFSPPSNGYALREEYGEQVRIVDLPNAGHGMVVEQPSSIASAIDTWILDYEA